MKMTEWFPANVKPVHDGLYETKSPVLDYQPGWFSYWDGEFWGDACRIQGFALDSRGRRNGCQDRPWRGLAEKPE